MSEKRYEAKPASSRRARAGVWTLHNGSEVVPGVRLRIEDKHAWLSPEKAYALANMLVDAAERAETAQRDGAWHKDTD
ncbi:hypothetical protein [Paeniglutamicibacter sulfureus]|uniref:DUF2188 domain-containing protein n=1 Tax=Paeniglutamicibacter sulfureus TaxID=43666 RepID=A0ABU2BN46_9MICC|nr:hypothetical protein [Paeniglutamicibacter sulfureus]MDR7360069.1 hypothetical protein [Paeniglutamicibacter sulfureus]